jgi:hypothetical protein
VGAAPSPGPLGPAAPIILVSGFWLGAWAWDEVDSAPASAAFEPDFEGVEKPLPSPEELQGG